LKKLRGAIVGFGRVAEDAHLAGFRSAAVDVLAVADASEERRAAAAAAVPGVRTYPTFDELAAGEAKSRLDFVDVATPPRFHSELAVAALDRGFHVLCEKPLARDPRELADVERAVRRTRRVVFTVNNWKYAPMFRRARGLVVAGSVGEVTEIEWNVERPSPPAGAVAEAAGWRLDADLAGGGVLTDHGWHAFYLMLYLTGRAPISLAATIERRTGLDVEDNAECTVDFAGLTARIRLSWTAPARRTHGTIRGRLGAIDIDDDRLVLRVDGREPEATRFAPPLSASSVHPEWFPPLLDDFRGEIGALTARGRNLAESVWCCRLVAAAYASGGGSVSLVSPDG
jgi:predicted dehydrogenase